MTTIGSTNGLSFVFAVVLAVVVCAGASPMVQPRQAKTDENSILPEVISASLYHTCGVRNDGTLACWGQNDYGQSYPYRNFFPLLYKP